MAQPILERIAALKAEASRELSLLDGSSSAEQFRVKYLGRKGLITDVLKSLGEIEPSMRPVVGKEINLLRVKVEEELSSVTNKIKILEQSKALSSVHLDVTLPGRANPKGFQHPLKQIFSQVVDIFTDMGFSVYEGPEIETDYYNFEALNVPPHHPARDMQDTFYVSGDKLLRTHTSPVQIHVMEGVKPPVYAVFPGAVYRRDNDVTHSPMFHQVEGLVVDTHITMGNLKAVLSEFCKKMFGKKYGVRFRPSFFPFTEPSAEVDITCVLCGGKGCRVCKNSGWLEILGCGMVDPNVFKAVNIDSKKYSGFAFGMGVERIAMLKYAISDIRLFYENDMRFLEQF